ncbi:SMI1/KNR4 family protein [Streptomyces sp. NPDC056244]|uniref:SMI1/KNR4 family protein n=1 Tax=unclassified Streptomyces TaxID=2593676 RepID=UPI0035DA5C7B
MISKFLSGLEAASSEMKLFRKRHVYPEGPFWSVYVRLVDEGFVDDRQSRGLTDSAIEEISRDQGVLLAPQYADFLRCMGAGSGRTLIGETIFHPAVLGIRANAEAMCAEFGIDCDLRDALFVASHQGYIYYYVDLRDGGVHCLTEDSVGPVWVADSFSAFLYDFVKSA